MTPRIRLPDDQGFSVHLYSGDHPPPHVHVRKAGKEAMIALLKPAVLESNMQAGDERKALNLIMKNQFALLKTWREHA